MIGIVVMYDIYSSRRRQSVQKLHYNTMPTKRRGMWVWDTSYVLDNMTEFISDCQAASITQVFLYLPASEYVDNEDAISELVSALRSCDIDAWGLEGSAAFFSASDGPAELYDTLEALCAYNDNVSVDSRFVGFQTDVELTSNEHPNIFHTGLSTSQLSSQAGTGVWQNSESEDRRKCLTEWLQMHIVLQQTAKAHGVRLGAALPPWLHAYRGEPLTLFFDGRNRTVMDHFADILDDYNIMSYSTEIADVAEQMFPALCRVPSHTRVFAGIETHTGVGEGISFGDDTGFNRSTVLNFIEQLETLFQRHPCFAGVNIHDYYGYKHLD